LTASGVNVIQEIIITNEETNNESKMDNLGFSNVGIGNHNTCSLNAGR